MRLAGSCATTAGDVAAPAAAQPGRGCCAWRSPRRQCRACAAHPRSVDSPSSGSRARAARLAPAPHGQSAGVPDPGAGRSSGGQPAGDASAEGSPVAPGRRSMSGAAAFGSTPQAPGRAPRTAADRPAGEESTPRAGAREPPTPWLVRNARQTRSTPAVGRRRCTAQKGNLRIAEWHGQRIRKVDPHGTITTIAGTGDPGLSGDRGRATALTLSNPWGVAVDRHGLLYIADNHNSRVWAVRYDDS